jgi:hypothetical protein
VAPCPCDSGVASGPPIQALSGRGILAQCRPFLALLGVGIRAECGGHRTQQGPLVEACECRSVAVRICFVGERPKRWGHA